MNILLVAATIVFGCLVCDRSASADKRLVQVEVLAGGAVHLLKARQHVNVTVVEPTGFLDSSVVHLDVSFKLGNTFKFRTLFYQSVVETNMYGARAPWEFERDLKLYDAPPNEVDVEARAYSNFGWEPADIVYEGHIKWKPGTILKIVVYRPDFRIRIDRWWQASVKSIKAFVQDAITFFPSALRQARARRNDAEAGDPFEQFELAVVYERIGRSSEAYKWYALAAKGAADGTPEAEPDTILAKDAVTARDRARSKLSAAQAASVAKLVDAWRPRRIGCHGSFWRRMNDGKLWNDLTLVCRGVPPPFRFSGGITF